MIGHIDINAENGNGFDNTGSSTYLNQGYLTWAGITAGKAPSFYSFVGGGDNWANIFSPDQKGFNEPDLMAYTASFGGGFSATIAAQSPGTNGVGRRHADDRRGRPNGSSPTPAITFGGQRWPDIVGAAARHPGLGRGPDVRRPPQRQRRRTTATTADWLAVAASARSDLTAMRRRTRSAGASTRA